MQVKSENEKLKNEREELIEISNTLRSKINRLEDEAGDPEKLKELEDEILALRESNEKLQELIDKMKKYVPSSVRKDLFDPEARDTLPERDNKPPVRGNEDLTRGSIDRFKAKIEDLRSELQLDSVKKPLIENKTHYTPNSHKATASQKEAEQKLKTKKKTPTKVRNYNIRDDDEEEE